VSLTSALIFKLFFKESRAIGKVAFDDCDVNPTIIGL